MELFRRLAGLPFLLLAAPLAIFTSVAQRITAFVITTAIQILGRQSSPGFVTIRRQLTDIVMRLHGGCPKCDLKDRP